MEPNFEALMKTIPGGDSLVKQLKMLFPSVSVGNMVNVTNFESLVVSAHGFTTRCTTNTGGSLNHIDTGVVVVPDICQNKMSKR